MSLTIAVTGQILIHAPLALTGAETQTVKALLQADAAIGNLEASVAVAGAWPTKTKTLHLAAADALHSLRMLGFTAVGHANNHAFDLGPPGIAATRTAANEAGLALAGSGLCLRQAMTPATLHPPGKRPIALLAVDLGPQPDIVYAAPDRGGIAPLRVTRAVSLPTERYGMLQSVIEDLGDNSRIAARQKVGYSATSAEQGFEAFGTRIVEGETTGAVWRTDAADRCRLLAEVMAAHAAGEFVVVALHCHHWDADWTRTPDWLTAIAHDLIDHGAGLILGTGAPLLQGMTLYKNRPILGGLGNFVFHTARAETYDRTGVDVWRSIAARLTFDDDGNCTDVEALPVAVGRPAEAEGVPHAPVPLAGDDAGEIMARFTSRLTPSERSLVRRFG